MYSTQEYEKEKMVSRMKFRVIDKKTGKEAAPYEIALHEEWAKDLCYCDMDGFAILEDGTLILVDECGKFEYCDPERFKVVVEDEKTRGEWEFLGDNLFGCTACGYVANANWLREWKQYTYDDEFPTACPKCGFNIRVKNELNRVSKELNKELNSEEEGGE